MFWLVSLTPCMLSAACKRCPSKVFSLVFQGRSDEAQRLMSYHGHYVAEPSNPYLIMESLLRT